MLRPKQLEIRAFRGWRESGAVRLDRDLTLILAGNRDGKSSTLNAMEWCLHGNQAAKKASGIAERADWEIRNREVDAGSMEVTLVLLDEGGDVRITRRREQDARARDDDTFQVTLPGGELLEQADAESWIYESGLPDWQTWRHAFCQHQEAARARLVEKTDRSALLAGLLGLDEYQQLQQRINDLKPRHLLKELESEVSGIEDELERSLERPRSDLEEIERRLEVDEGIPRAEVNEHKASDVARSLAGRGARMAQDLRMEEPVPAGQPGSDPETTLRWARDWEKKVRHRLDDLRKQQSRRREDERRLAGALDDLQPAHDRRQAALREKQDLEREHGNAEALSGQAEQIDSDLEQLDAAITAEEDRMSCIRQARDLLHAADHADRCPVCEQASPELGTRLEAILQEGETAAIRKLQGRREELKGRRETLTARRRKLELKTQETKDQERAYRNRKSLLQAHLPSDFDPASGDAHSEGHEQLRRQRESIRATETILQSTEEDLGAHRKEADILGWLAKWLAARNRARVSGDDLSRHSAWNDLQAALDEAAGLAVDIQALGAMAREAEEQRSSERVDEVNRCLGTYFTLITGTGERDQVRVQVHRTATRLRYNLVDDSGKSVLPILNQAALNSLSLAMLFAQAEDRARNGWPAWVVLDDPGQSLDPQRVEGLARAIERIAGHCPVIAGVMPGALAEHLTGIESRTRRVVRLAPWESAAGVRVLEETVA